MVIPMSMSIPQFSGPPPREIQKPLSIIKYFVITEYICGFLRMIWDPFGALNDIFCGLSGTFLLKSDSTLKGCYGCLMNSPLAMCGEGGLNCLVPFSLMCMFSGVLNLIRAIIMVSQAGLLPCVNDIFCFIPLVQMIVSIAELASCYFGWRVFQSLQGGSGGYDDPERAAGHAQSGYNPTPAPAMQQPFIPFSGSGNRLGTDI